MSSPDDRPQSAAEPTRRAVLAGLACVAALPLAGCLTPLYGPTAQGVGLEQTLRAVQVEPVGVAPDGEVLGHYLRQELAFALDGTGRATTQGPKAFSLMTNAVVSTASPIVDATTLRANVSTLRGTASYRLVRIDGGEVLDSGSVQGAVTYENTVQRFAAVRAAREAQIRLAKLLADELRTQVAVALRTAPGATFASGS
jgi:LPS-assembly lipoprotein